MTTVQMLRACGDGISNHAADEIEKLERENLAFIGRMAELELLLIRKNEALAVFASKGMWVRFNTPGQAYGVNQTYHWNGDGAGHYRDPMAFAKRESEATEPDDR